jgi:5-methylcytosine-specific restriction endonuclease McrA
MTHQDRLNLKKMPYAEFLKTSFWYVVRERVRQRDGNLCQMCGDERQNILEVHHRTYEHHGREDEYIGDLILLCDECHYDVTRKPHLQAWPYRDMGDEFSLPEEEA